MKFTEEEKQYLLGQIEGLTKEINQECGFIFSYFNEKLANLRRTILRHIEKDMELK